MAENQLFQTALSKNGASFKLWSAYIEWIEKKWQDDVLKSDTVDELLTVSRSPEYQSIVWRWWHYAYGFFPLLERMPKSNRLTAIAGGIYVWT